MNLKTSLFIVFMIVITHSDIDARERRILTILNNKMDKLKSLLVGLLEKNIQTLQLELKTMKYSLRSELEATNSALKLDALVQMNKIKTNFQQDIAKLYSELRDLRFDFDEHLVNDHDTKERLNSTSFNFSGNIDDNNPNSCQPISVGNAVVNPSTAVPHGTAVTVICIGGYTMIGKPTTTCRNGSFDAIPSCGFDISLTKPVNGTRVNIQLKGDFKQPKIIGSAFLPDGRLLLCDFYNENIKVLGDSFHIDDVLHLPGRHPFSAAVINDTTMIVSFPTELQLQFLKFNPVFEIGDIIKFDVMCWGINVVNQTIYVTCHNYTGGHVKVLDITGNILRTLGVINEHDQEFIFNGPYHVTVSPVSGRVYVSDWQVPEKVTCLSANGDIIYSYSDPDLGGPGAILADDFDTIVFCDYYSKNLQILNSNGSHIGNLLTESDGMNNPYTLAYRPSDSTLVVAGRTRDLLIFKLSLK